MVGEVLRPLLRMDTNWENGESSWFMVHEVIHEHSLLNELVYEAWGSPLPPFGWAQLPKDSGMERGKILQNSFKGNIFFKWLLQADTKQESSPSGKFITSR